MIFWLIPFILLFIILFFLSRSLIKNLYVFFFYLTKTKKTSVQLLTLILLPGTVIHELSHLFIAEILRVPTGELFFAPEMQEDEQKIKAGGLKMAKTGPLRHALIGLAPTIVGLGLILLLSHFLKLYLNNLIISLPLSYLIFTISNTMFSSKKDLATIMFPLIILLVFSTAFWLQGWQLTLPQKMVDILSNMFKNLSLGLAITLGIDLVGLGVIKLLTLPLKKA